MAKSVPKQTVLEEPDHPPAPPKPRRLRKAPKAGKTALTLAGAFGGISPNLLYIAVSLTQGTVKEISFDATYMIGILLFAFLGGSLTLIWGETELQRAFYLGLGLPSLLQVGIGSAIDGKAKKDQPQEQRSGELQTPPGFSLFSTPAFAQGEPPSAKTPSPAPQQQPSAGGPELARPRILKLHWDSVPRGTEVLLLSSSGEVRTAFQLDPAMVSSPITMTVDTSITSFQMKVGDLRSEVYRLDQHPASTTSYEVDIDKNTWRGFWQALGARDVPRFKFEIEKLPGEGLSTGLGVEVQKVPLGTPPGSGPRPRPR